MHLVIAHHPDTWAHGAERTRRLMDPILLDHESRVTRGAERSICPSDQRLLSAHLPGEHEADKEQQLDPHRTTVYLMILIMPVSMFLLNLAFRYMVRSS